MIRCIIKQGGLFDPVFPLDLPPIHRRPILRENRRLNRTPVDAVDQQIVEQRGIAPIAFPAGDQAGHAVIEFVILSRDDRHVIDEHSYRLLFEPQFEVVPAIESPVSGLADGELFIA